MTAVPLSAAARELGISLSTLRRDIAAGAPVARRGGRGRGHVTLLDLQAFAAWRRSRAAAEPSDALVAFAGEVPELLAAALHAAFVQIDGPHKRECAGVLAGAWYLATTALLDRLRRGAPTVADVHTLPEKITTLRMIFGTSGSLQSSSLEDR